MVKLINISFPWYETIRLQNDQVANRLALHLFTAFQIILKKYYYYFIEYINIFITYLVQIKVFLYDQYDRK